jgi:hypothetical protein
MTMPKRPRYPTIYEINAWVWLSDLSKKAGATVDLSAVPSAAWDTIAKFGFDAEWLKEAEDTDHVDIQT